jgi:hypothetical protein
MSRKHSNKRNGSTPAQSTDHIPFITAPDLSITITRAEATNALKEIHSCFGVQWPGMSGMTQTFIAAAALAQAMGHDPKWTIDQLTHNRYFRLAASALASEYTKAFHTPRKES